MSLNINDLVAYVDENATDLARKAVNTGKTLSLFPQTGVRGLTKKLNTIVSTVVGRAATCGFTDASTTKLSQNTLKVENLMFDHSICLQDFRAYVTDLARNPSKGSYNDELPFGAQIFEDWLAQIALSNELMVWKGNKASGSGNLGLIDGIQTVLAGKAFIDANDDGQSGKIYATVTAANIIEVIDHIDDNFSEDIVEMPDNYIFVPIAWYRMYIKAIRDANLYHHDSNMGDLTYKIPATDTTLMGVRGLSGADAAYAFNLSNVVVGVAEGGDKDVENFITDFEKKTSTLWMKVNYALGVQFYFYEEVTVFEL